ncbi:hypothetical protein B0H34DRAFT_712459, partial [Crassisporium funariophilum]
MGAAGAAYEHGLGWYAPPGVVPGASGSGSGGVGGGAAYPKTAAAARRQKQKELDKEKKSEKDSVRDREKGADGAGQAAGEGRARTPDTKFSYIHYRAHTCDSPTTPHLPTLEGRRKRVKVDSSYLEKFEAQTLAISESLALDRARRGVGFSGAGSAVEAGGAGAQGEAPALAPAPLTATLVAGGVPRAEPIVDSNSAAMQDSEVENSEKPTTRQCSNKTCSRSIAAETPGTICDQCRLRFKKHQAKTKQRFKLEPKRSLLDRVIAGRAGVTDGNEMAVDVVERGEST